MLAAFERVLMTLKPCCVMPEYPDAVNPRSPERQGPPRRRPEYDYFHDVNYLDYFNSGRTSTSTMNDYFDYDDYFDYFLSDPKTAV